jgi:hypothetical protein
MPESQDSHIGGWRRRYFSALRECMSARLRRCRPKCRGDCRGAPRRPALATLRLPRHQRPNRSPRVQPNRRVPRPARPIHRGPVRRRSRRQTESMSNRRTSISPQFPKLICGQNLGLILRDALCSFFHERVCGSRLVGGPRSTQSPLTTGWAYPDLCYARGMVFNSRCNAGRAGGWVG